MQIARIEKKAKEEREHKERMAKMKAQKKQRAQNLKVNKRVGGFDRSKLSGAFMANARGGGGDNVQGWGMDFENPTAVANQEDAMAV